jgi:endonuclease YncB( thermonuclease family)
MLIRDGLIGLDDSSELVELAKAEAYAQSQKIGIWNR